MTSHRVLSALLLVALLLAPLGALLWLDDQGAHSDAVVRAPSPAEAVAGALAAQGTDADVLPSRDALSPEGSAPVALGSSDAALPVRRFRGLVVGPDGAPVVGARVVLVTHPAVGGQVFESRAVLGDLRARLALTDPAGLPAVQTGDDGRFAFDVPLETHTWAEVAPAAGWTEADEAFADELVTPRPTLLVTHPEHAPHWHDCASPTELHDVGTLTLASGARVSGRCIDEHGRPLEGVLVGLDLDAEFGECPPEEVALEGDGEALVIRSSCGGLFAGPETEGRLLLDDRLWLTRSDADGRFLLSGLPAGRTPVWTWAEGRVPARAPILRLEAGAALDVGELLLPAGGRVAGRVLDAAGQPLAGAVVRGGAAPVDPALDVHRAWRLHAGRALVGLHATDNRLARARAFLHAQTDSDGRFELSSIDTRRLPVLATAAGHDVAVLHDVAVGRRDLELRLALLDELGLAFVDASGAPVAVHAAEVYHRGFDWVIDGADDDELRLRADAPEQGLWTVQGACEHALRLDVQLPSGRRVRPVLSADSLAEVRRDGRRLRVEVAEPARRRGRVVDAAGEPLRGARVASSDWPRFDRGQRVDRHGSQVDEQGLFTLEAYQLLAGRLWVRAPGQRTRVLDVPPAALAGGLFELGDVVLSPAGTLDVSVRAHDGRGLADGRLLLQLHLEDGRWLTSAEADLADDGPTRLPWRETGAHRLVLAPGAGGAVGLAQRALPGKAPMDLALAWNLAAPRRLTGVVRRGDQPVAGARLVVSREVPLDTLMPIGGALPPSVRDDLQREAPPGVVRSDADGRFALSVMGDGPLRVHARAIDGALSAERLLDGHAAGDIELDLPLAERTVTGHVLFQGDEAPVVGAELVLLRDGRVLTTTTTDDLGRFLFAGVPDDDALRLQLRPGPGQRALVPQLRWSVPRMSDLEPLLERALGAGEQDCELRLPRLASLDLALVDRHGAPLDAHHSVLLDRPDNTDRMAIAMGVADSDGTVQFWSLPAGDYRVRVYPVADPREVLSNATEHLVMARLELTLTPGERRQLRVAAGW